METTLGIPETVAESQEMWRCFFARVVKLQEAERDRLADSIGEIWYRMERKVNSW